MAAAANKADLNLQHLQGFQAVQGPQQQVYLSLRPPPYPFLFFFDQVIDINMRGG